jgi:hypothetical protein
VCCFVLNGNRKHRRVCVSALESMCRGARGVWPADLTPERTSEWRECDAVERTGILA